MAARFSFDVLRRGATASVKLMIALRHECPLALCAEHVKGTLEGGALPQEVTARELRLARRPFPTHSLPPAITRGVCL